MTAQDELNLIESFFETFLTKEAPYLSKVELQEFRIALVLLIKGLRK